MPVQHAVRVLARIVLGLYFLVFGGDKIISGQFTAPTQLADWTAEQLAGGHAFPIVRPFLEEIVMPNGHLLSWVVAIAEFGLGICLLTGLLLGPAAALGAVLMAVIGFASTAPPPGAGLAATLGGTLQFVALILLLLMISADAERLSLGRGGGGGGGGRGKKSKE
jgi:uncharacterized membrane protein YphA (DoxX/SURF4 family)